MELRGRVVPDRPLCLDTLTVLLFAILKSTTVHASKFGNNTLFGNRTTSSSQSRVDVTAWTPKPTAISSLSILSTTYKSELKAFPRTCKSSIISQSTRFFTTDFWVCSWEPSMIVTSVFETLEKIGPGISYEAYGEGIARFRPDGPPTTTISRIVTAMTTERCYTNAELAYRVETWTGGNGPECDRKWVQEQDAYMRTKNHEYSEEFDISEMVTETKLKECSIPPVEEVILLYWPSTSRGSSPRNTINHNSAGTAMLSTRISHAEPQSVVVRMDNITFQGQDLVPRSVISGSITTLLEKGYIRGSTLTGSFFLTSPTVYLAHRPITAIIGTYSQVHIFSKYFTQQTFILKSAGLIPLNSTDVFSVRRIPRTSTVSGVELARQVAFGLYDPMWDMNEIRLEAQPLDFRHLQDPVPASVYFEARHGDCFGNQSHCATITDDSYRPILYIKSLDFMTSLVKEGYPCNPPFLNDPPIALVQIEDTRDLAPPKLPMFRSSHPAPHITPASGLLSDDALRGNPEPEQRSRPGMPPVTAAGNIRGSKIKGFGAQSTGMGGGKSKVWEGERLGMTHRNDGGIKKGNNSSNGPIMSSGDPGHLDEEDESSKGYKGEVDGTLRRPGDRAAGKGGKRPSAYSASATRLLAGVNIEMLLALRVASFVCSLLLWS